MANDAIKNLDLYEMRESGCSASGKELRAQLWPVKQPVVKAEKDKGPKESSTSWRAIAYILVSLFTAGSALAGGFAYRDQVTTLFSHIDRKVTDIWD